MHRWEYFTTRDRSLESMEAELNRLGAEGWELVGVVSPAAVSMSDSIHVEVVLKRRLAEARRERS